MRRSRGFTIIELLVVVGIIAILTSLVVTAVFRGMAQSKKTRELNRLRQIHVGWTVYANNNNDACVPGFVDPGVQAAWKLKYRYQDGNDLPPELAQTYLWRLAGYIGYAIDPVLGGREDYQFTLDTSEFLPPDVPVALPAEILPGLAMAGAGAAFQPGFGYNAFYLGGWWSSASGVPQMRFVDGTYTESNGAVVRGRLVSRHVAGVQRPSEVIAFASSTYYGVGFHGDPDDFIPGAAWVTPNRLGSQDIWGFGGAILQGVDAAASFLDGGLVGGKQSLVGSYEVYVDGAAVPLRRYGELVATGKVDGSTESIGLAGLTDMRRWIPAATTPNFTHTDN